MVDVKRIREDFPILNEVREGKPIVYADSACMALKPKQVINALISYYEKYTACGGRSAHKFAKETTTLYEGARNKIAKFINSSSSKEIIWTRNTTESANIVMRGMKWNKGDKIISDDVAHNSNIVPWMYLKNQYGVDHQLIDIPTNGNFDIELLKEKIDRKTKLVALTHVSNIMGVSNDVKTAIKIAHDNGALVFLDSAQSLPHQSIDVQDLDVDFLGASIHKACGPTGIGILYGKFDKLLELGKWTVGGETVVNTTIENGPEFAAPPACFEAGLQNYAAVIGSGAAIDYLSNIGMENIHNYEKKLASLLTKGLSDLSNYGLHIIGPMEKDSALAAFYVDDLDSHDINIMLDDMYNIFLRSGRHCTHAWHNKMKIESTTRPSWYLYNTEEEIRFFLDSLDEILQSFKS